MQFVKQSVSLIRDRKLRSERQARLEEELMHHKVMEVLGWIYALMGRLLHAVGDLDNWQVILALIGKAGTGKSTIIEQLMGMFETEDVGNISGKGDKFSIAAVADKLLWACPELAKNLNISQQMLQQMISGERVTIRGFFKDWEQVHWNIPGVLGGNFLPNWSNDQGSLTRRIIMLGFFRSITKDQKDPKLPAKIKGETARFVAKISRMYMRKVRAYGDRDLWGSCMALSAGSERGPLGVVETAKVFTLPSYFHLMRQHVGKETDPLAAFVMGDENLVVDKNAITIVNTLNEKARRLHMPASESLFQNAKFHPQKVPHKALQIVFPKEFNPSDAEIGIRHAVPFTVFARKWQEWAKSSLAPDEEKRIRYTARAFGNDFASTALELGIFLFNVKSKTTFQGTEYGGLWVANVDFSAKPADVDPEDVDAVDDSHTSVTGEKGAGGFGGGASSGAGGMDFGQEFGSVATSVLDG